jgi:D-amino-acid dehydrogenase
LALIPGLKDAGSTQWMGRRPVTPDYLPVIGRAPRHPSVIFAFGHGHSGYNLGPATGRLVGEVAAGRTPNIDIAPYRPDRF